LNPDNHYIQAICKDLENDPTSSLTVTGLRGAAPALFLTEMIAATRHTLFCVVPNDQIGITLEQDLGLFTEVPVLFYPAYDIPPYTPLSPDRNSIAARLSSLYTLFTAQEPIIFIASAEAILRKVMTPESISGLAELLMVGEDIEQVTLSRRLVSLGYEQASLVQSVGQFSVRGGIVDIFSPGFDAPLRLDFFGDTIESMRHFDPISQRSIADAGEVILLPAHECLYPSGDNQDKNHLERFDHFSDLLGWQREQSGQLESILQDQRYFPGIEFFLPFFHEKLAIPLDFVPSKSLVILFDPIEIQRSMDLTRERIETNFQESQNTSTIALPPDELFCPLGELHSSIQEMATISLFDFTTQEMEKSSTYKITSGNHLLIKQELEIQRRSQGLLPPLAKVIGDWLEREEPVSIACRSDRHAKHLAELLHQHHLPVSIKETPMDLSDQQPDVLSIYPHPISQGFDLPDINLHVLSESELFGEPRLGPRKRKRRKEAGAPVRFEELHSGDIVVHEEHGLGTYKGMISMEVGGVGKDFLLMVYKDDEKLYVPVDRLRSITKYKGLTDKKPKINRLGGKKWGAVKSKVKEAVWKVAQDLLKLYAKRQLIEGKQFSQPDSLYEELEESFPFEETQGQQKAINDILQDLTSSSCMDRLVCGDVGYGKTEVAMRAAFKVVADKYQVAVLVPTTVLAEQHTESFRERFAGFPVKIHCLNRFRSKAEQKETLKGLKDGKVDIVIGTHRLLSKDVDFGRLGLLIVDEEHRFGVANKEKLKRLRVGLDVLTLTATPIPRTLQMSLLGVRDLSVISTPPAHRRSVKTFVAKYDDLVIKEAVTRELQRKGQVFVVHNRVQSIHEMARSIQKLVPQARVAVAHGQLPGKELEEIMVSFVRREVDVLVCTTIIESGLDIPNANTIVITRADRLGLAEIYQLRGRVGRSREQAFAYLLVPSMDGLSKDAKQRLQALMDYNELGGGFKLAMSDLQIRGGGNILGESQSGQIAAVGYDLYLDLLQKTVEDLKRKQQTGEHDETIDIEPEINLQLAAFFPDSYITDANQRYVAYRRISFLATHEELNDFESELADRYGPLPAEAKNLITVISLRLDLQKAQVVRLEKGDGNLVFSFHEQTVIKPESIFALMKRGLYRARLLPDSRLVAELPKDKQIDPIQVAEEILHALLKNNAKLS